MSAYISYIQEKERKRLYQIQLENNLTEIGTIKNIVRSNSAKIEKFKGIKNQIEIELQNENSISNLKTKLNNSSNLSILETVLSELENIKNFPTSQTENEVRNQIAYCYNTMKMEDIQTSIDRCVIVNNNVVAERNRIELEERERLEREAEERKQRNIKIAKYVGIALAIGLGLWILLAFVVPFIIQWWWAILLVAVIIGYFISKSD